MDDREFAVTVERVHQFRIICDSLEDRLKRLELLQSSIDKSLAVYEIGLQGLKEWLQDLEIKLSNLEEDRQRSTRYWLSILISIGALVTAIVGLVIKTMGG